MRKLFILIILLLFPKEIQADIFVGLSLDASSNMLHRPDGASGLFTTLYGVSNISRGALDFTYGVDAGMLETYEGIQYHRHRINASYRFSKKRFSTAIDFWGTLARYGEITILGGYYEAGLSGKIKTYAFNDKTLIRWWGNLKRRMYVLYNIENYYNADTYFRLDRFFTTGTTLRLNAGFGLRTYTDTFEPFTASLIDLKLRVAQSIKPLWGMWIEMNLRKTGNGSVSDSLLYDDRVFLDDYYKSSLMSGDFYTKYIFMGGGSVQAGVEIMKRMYAKNLESIYWYVPDNGWDEWEYRTSLRFSYPLKWLSDKAHPSVELYYIDVDASVSEMSFDSTGVTFRIEWF